MQATPPIITSSNNNINSIITNNNNIGNNRIFFNSSIKKDSLVIIDSVASRDPSNFPDHINDSNCKSVANCADGALHNQNDSSVINLKGKLENLEQELDERTKENDQLKDYRKKAREVLIKTLMQQSELERRSTRERVNNNKLHLGQFRPYRQGAHYEEKWSEGLKYQDLEK